MKKIKLLSLISLIALFMLFLSSCNNSNIDNSSTTLNSTPSAQSSSTTKESTPTTQNSTSTSQNTSSSTSSNTQVEPSSSSSSQGTPTTSTSQAEPTTTSTQVVPSTTSTSQVVPTTSSQVVPTTTSTSQVVPTTSSTTQTQPTSTTTSTSKEDVYFDVVFKNYDDTVLDTQRVKEGDIPSYTKSNPARSNDDNYKYRFSGWSPSLSAIGSNTTYVAQYTKEDLPYTITINLNGGSSETTKLTFKTENFTSSLLPYDLTKNGYTFQGYEYNDVKVFDQNGNKVNDFEMSANMTFKAIFELNEYRITIDNKAKDVVISGITNGKKYEFGSTITLVASNIPTNNSVYWTRDDGEMHIGRSYMFTIPSRNLTITVRSEIIYERNDTIYFGSYPQTKVTDDTLITELNTLAGELPIATELGNWTDYNYYIKRNVTSYMYYQDIDYDNDGTYDYRGVYFTHYRPSETSRDGSEEDYSPQSYYGYNTNSIYWFSYDPIEWNILKNENGESLIIANLILDSQDYCPSHSPREQFDHNGGIGYENNYELSNIRKWLNDTFYNTAFNTQQKTLIKEVEVDNGIDSTVQSSSNYVCNNTNDNIFLLSYEEATTYYLDWTSRIAQGSDYAKSQGLYIGAMGNYTSNMDDSCWWLRSPQNTYKGVFIVSLEGEIGTTESGSMIGAETDWIWVGVRPALWIKSDKIYFGSYPQTKVTDDTLITELNTLAGTLPTTENLNNWTDYNYYLDGNITSYMYYQDIDYDNDGEYDYRGVYFTQYRPYSITTSNSNYSHQDDSGYDTNPVYWFSYDPVEWDILTEENGKYLLIANLILDSQEYYSSSNQDVFEHNGGTGYANNYELSNIRKWLNANFYNTAFNDLQKSLIEITTVDNSASSTGDSSNQYACNNTNDNVFLLSYQELRKYYNLPLTEVQATDYAKSQGLRVSPDIQYLGSNSFWLLRSPDIYSTHIYGVYGDGYAYNYLVYGTDFGVRPALWIKLDNNNRIYFGSYPQTKVTDDTLITELNTLAGTLPTTENLNNWTDYSYYIEGNITSYMYYQDIDYDNDGNYDYRGVYFTQYRPRYSNYPAIDSFQEQNGFDTNVVYWFSYDPIEWDILQDEYDRALLIANLILDTQDFYPSNYDEQFEHNGGTGYANNYELSNIRKWLNDTFYNTAFNDFQKSLIETTIVDNSATSTYDSSNIYACDNTIDNIFILSVKEAIDYDYASLQYDLKKETFGSDYAKVQGLCTFNNYNGSSVWYLRSPSTSAGASVDYVADGHISLYMGADSIAAGIRPSFWIKLDNINKLYFGSYPQTKVTDATLITELNTLADTLPTSTELGNWTDYNYYIEENVTSYMYFQDIDCDNDGLFDYRGVYFTQYRPYEYNLDSSESNTYQYDNGYNINIVYWFKFEPIEWDILKEENGRALLIANLILDSQDYYPSSSSSTFNHNDDTGYANNYALSNIRKWLNEAFYNSAFSELQKTLIQETEVDNSAPTTANNTNKYACNNTQDKLFLLSYQETSITYYTTDSSRQAQGTDYAKSQGLYVYDLNGMSYWWLRSPSYYNGTRAHYVFYNGTFAINGVSHRCDQGVRPAMWINL